MKEAISVLDNARAVLYEGDVSQLHDVWQCCERCTIISFGKLHPFHSSVLSSVSFVCATETSSNQPKLLGKMRYFPQFY
jgi:hypothetical protein